MSFIGDQFIKTAVYIGIRRDGGVVPGGTGFVMSIPIGRGDSAREYLVTARHVLEECRSDDVFVTANAADGARVEVQTHRGDWLLSREADVAVLPIPGWRGRHAWETQVVPKELLIGPGEEYVPFFTDREAAGGNQVAVGDEVFFAGLFVQSAGAARNVPVTRFGRVARMPGEPLLLRRYGGAETFRAHGYLVEALSLGGFSGSPAFWRRPAMRRIISGGGQIGAEMTFVVALLGLVSAHYDLSTEAVARIGEEQAKVELRANSGLAVVTPSTEILALCEREDAVELHDRLAAK